MITQTIAEILDVKPWEGRHGTVYFHKIKMADGTIGEIGKKSMNALTVGQSLTYTVEEGQYGNKFKEVQQNGFGGGGFAKNSGSRGSTASFALSYAKDIAVANIKMAGEPIPMDGLAEKVIATASKFNEWLKNNE